MSQNRRALFIAVLGPVLQLFGVVWDLLDHGLLAREDLNELGLTHLISGPSHLLMATGFLVAVFCIPVALQVATASPEEVEESCAAGEAAEVHAKRSSGEIEWQQQ